MKKIVAIPPDATPFRAKGQQYFLRMGPLEMRNLQREWGLVRAPEDTPEEWERKKLSFNERIDGPTMEDKVAVIRHGLTQWAIAAANGEGPIALDEARVFGILQEIEGEPVEGKHPKAGFVLVTELHTRFLSDCFGMTAVAKTTEPGVPKEQPVQGSIPSSS